MLNQTEFRSTKNQTVTVPTPSIYKTFAFAIAIIIGIGGLVTASVGLAAFYNVGTFSSLSQVQAISMMGVGGFAGHSLIVVAIACLLQKPQTKIQQPTGSPVHSQEKSKPQEISTVNSASTSHKIQHPSGNTVHSQEKPKPQEISNVNAPSTPAISHFYGPLAFEKAFNVEIVEKVPPLPKVNWDDKDPYFNQPFQENYVLFYIPEKIREKGQVKVLDLETFKNLSDKSFSYFSQYVIDQFGKNTAAGWVLMSKQAIPDSAQKDYSTQKNLVEMHAGFQMTNLFGNCVLNLLVDACSHVKLYPSSTFARCMELFRSATTNHPIIVGNFTDGLVVRLGSIEDPLTGVAVMKTF